MGTRVSARTAGGVTERLRGGSDVSTGGGLKIRGKVVDVTGQGALVRLRGVFMV